MTTAAQRLQVARIANEPPSKGELWKMANAKGWPALTCETIPGFSTVRIEGGRGPWEVILLRAGPRWLAALSEALENAQCGHTERQEEAYEVKSEDTIGGGEQGRLLA